MIVSNSDMRTRFEFAIRNGASATDERLLIEREGEFATFYAPFEHTNRRAKLAIVGLTPGLYQSTVAIELLKCELDKGVAWNDAVEVAKNAASFSGAMRTKLVSMLDAVGLNLLLGLPTCGLLFSTHPHLVQFTSLLRFPVFFRGRNYDGSPPPSSSAFLTRQVDAWFRTEFDTCPDAVFLPLGSSVRSLMSRLASDTIPAERLLHGIPHPSGANAERIAYFLGKKRREQLSNKTDAQSLDVARTTTTSQVALMRSPPLPKPATIP
jgi:hypothetical protein